MKARIILIAAALVLAGPQAALAYVGPGLGLGAIGVIFGVVFSVILAAVALFWYPIKRALGLGKRQKSRVQEGQANEKADG
jgi:hypothetical protein